MSVRAIIPTGPEVLREALIVMAGALLAVAVVRVLPVEWQQWFSLNGGAEP